MKRALLMALCLTALALPARGEVILGAHIPVGSPDTYEASIRSFWNATGREHPLIMFFIPYNHPAEGEYGIARIVEVIHSVGAVPIITWEFYAGDLDDPAYRLANIAAGNYDSSIRATAQALAREEGEVILRVLHEFDTTCYPWGVPRPWNGSAEEFKAAFRHIAEVVRAAGASNVKMMWSPNYMSNVENFDIWACYPGDDVVDCVGTSGLNGEPENVLRTPGLLFDQLLREFAWRTTWTSRSSSRMAALTKPQFIVEFGTVHYNYGQGYTLYPAEEWIRDAYPYMASNFPCLSGVCWFNGFAYHPSVGAKDFRVVANPGEAPVIPSITQAYREAINNAHYTTAWPGFENLPKPNGYPSPPVATLPDRTPQLRFEFNHPENAALRGSDILVGTFFMYPYGEADIYLVIATQSGGFISYTAARGWVDGIVPAVSRMPIHYNARGSVVLYKFNGTEPPGTYTILWALVRPGSRNPAADIIGPIGEWKFNVR